MVNTGKPSAGCYMCRKRRIKCDEAKPSCGNCQKSKRVCPGYRDPWHMRLSSGRKTGKKQREYASSHLVELIPHTIRTQNGNSTSDSDDGVFRLARACDLSTTYFRLSSPVDTRATCFFMTHFVLVPGEQLGLGHLDWAFEFGRSEKDNSPFQLALLAAGLAAYGAKMKTRSIVPLAHQQYAKCLKAINSALIGRDAAMDDSILAAILLLVVFEEVTVFEMNLVGWQSHIDGAVAFIKHRGAKSFKSPTSRALFNAVRELMTIHHIARSLPIDSSIDWLYHMPLSDDLGRKYATFNMRLGELRAINTKATAYGPRTVNKTVQVVELLHKAKTLEKEYREWFNSLPTSFSSSLAWVDYGAEDTDLSTVMAYPGRVETYEELYVAYLYNIARSSQILIWYTILRCVAWLFEDKDYRISPEYTEASRRCRELIQGIISSMPYFFIWDSGDIGDRIQERLQAHCEKANMKGSSATFLMWPLYVVGNSDFATAAQRTFTRGKLKYVADHVGISQASLMLQLAVHQPSFYIALDRGQIPPELMPGS